CPSCKPAGGSSGTARGQTRRRFGVPRSLVGLLIGISLNQLRRRLSGGHALIQMRQRLNFLRREEELQRRRNLKAILARANLLEDAVLLDLLNGGVNPFHEPRTVGIGGAL